VVTSGSLNVEILKLMQITHSCLVLWTNVSKLFATKLQEDAMFGDLIHILTSELRVINALWTPEEVSTVNHSTIHTSHECTSAALKRYIPNFKKGTFLLQFGHSSHSPGVCESPMVPHVLLLSQIFACIPIARMCGHSKLHC